MLQGLTSLPTPVYYSLYYIDCGFIVSFIIDFFPLAFFFVAYKFADIYIASGILIMASAVQLIMFRVRAGKFEKSKIWMFLGILLFGGITIVLHDDFYLKIKVSIIFTIISLALLGSFFVGQKQPLVKTIALKTGDNFSKVPESRWYLINWLWIGFFFSIAIINLYVAFNFSLDTWVSFKVWGITILNFVLMMISLFLIFPYMEEQPENQSGE